MPRKKHSSLFRWRDNDDEKKFYNNDWRIMGKSFLQFILPKILKKKYGITQNIIEIF